MTTVNKSASIRCRVSDNWFSEVWTGNSHTPQGAVIPRITPATRPPRKSHSDLHPCSSSSFPGRTIPFPLHLVYQLAMAREMPHNKQHQTSGNATIPGNSWGSCTWLGLLCLLIWAGFHPRTEAVSSVPPVSHPPAVSWAYSHGNNNMQRSQPRT